MRQLRLITRCNGLILTLLTLFLSTNSQAEQKQSFGPYDVHYSVFASTFITPEVAKAYGLKRSPNLHLLNITVRRNNPDGSSSEQAANITGTLNDLMRKDPLHFREIRETGAVYYLAEVPVQYVQLLIFNIDVSPEGSNSHHHLQFQTRLYPDDK